MMNLLNPVLTSVLTLSMARAAETCQTPLSLSALQALMADIEKQYVAMNLDAFRLSVDRASLQLPCLEVVLPEADAARYHRLQGLQAMLVRDTDRARLAFLAARSIEPDTQLSERLVPEGHPVRIQYAALPLDSIAWTPLQVPVTGQVWVDGRSLERLPTSCPAILQVADSSGHVESTTYLWPGQSLPYAVAPLRSFALSERGQRSSTPLLLAGAGVAGLGAGALTWLAWQRSESYHDPATPLAELDDLRSQTNLYNGAAIGVGAGALGLGVAAALTWQW